MNRVSQDTSVVEDILINGIIAWYTTLGWLLWNLFSREVAYRSIYEQSITRYKCSEIITDGDVGVGVGIGKQKLICQFSSLE